MKKKAVLTVAIILTLAITGCGADNNNTTQKKNVEATDGKKTEKQTRILKDTEEAAKEGQKNDEATEESGKSVEQESTLSEKDLASDSNASGKEGVSNNNSITQEHIHTWVHHDATGHYETVTIKEAYDEKIEENVEYDCVESELAVCNGCGADITENVNAHLDAAVQAYLNGETEDWVCGGYHSEVYKKGYCYWCGGKIESRQCDFTGYSPMCSVSEAFQTITTIPYQIAGGGTGTAVIMLRRSCDCGKNEIFTNGQNGKGLIRKVSTVHHDEVTEQKWVQDTPAYDQCSECGATK